MEKCNLIPFHMYGLTETHGPITKSYSLPEWQRMPDEVKYAKMSRQGQEFITSMPGRAIRVSQSDTGSLEVSKEGLIDVTRNGSEIGEVVFVGNICAKGYYKDPAATKKLFEGGVLHSGDLAVWHADGAIQILDRVKGIIISGGENVSSLALEALIVTHPDILEAACIALKDEIWGKSPKIYATLRAHANGATTGTEVVKWVSQQSVIPRFAIPKEVEIVNGFSKTSTGKIRKSFLREWTRGVKARL